MVHKFENPFETFYPPEVPIEQSTAFIADIFRFNETLEVVNSGLGLDYTIDSYNTKIKNAFLAQVWVSFLTFNLKPVILIETIKGSAPDIETNVEYTQFLYNQMVGDIGFILPGILDAKLYSDAGVTTYAYYLGMSHSNECCERFR